MTKKGFFPLDSFSHICSARRAKSHNTAFAIKTSFQMNICTSGKCIKNPFKQRYEFYFCIITSFRLDLEKTSKPFPSMAFLNDYCKFSISTDFVCRSTLPWDSTMGLFNAAVVVRVEKMSMDSNLNALDVNRRSDRFSSFRIKENMRSIAIGQRLKLSCKFCQPFLQTFLLIPRKSPQC